MAGSACRTAATVAGYCLTKLLLLLGWRRLPIAGRGSEVVRAKQVHAPTVVTPPLGPPV